DHIWRKGAEKIPASLVSLPAKDPGLGGIRAPGNLYLGSPD
ncbi:hypothetical protein Leryth_022449, partial [Lithospermum erythrorhizon]